MSTVNVPATGHGDTQTRVDRVVIHGTVGPCTPGHSVNIARYLNSVGLSAHYVVDPTTITRMLDEHVIGYHDGHNVNEVGIELCDAQAGDPARWDDPAHTAMLALAAPLIRGICQRHDVPMTRITSPLGTKRGICGHGDVSRTWHSSTHTDPDAGGPFPWARLIAMVNQQEDGMSAAEVKAINDNTNTRIGAIDRNNVIRHGEVIARMAAVERAVAASPDNPVTQDQLNEAVAKGLAGASIKIEPGS